MDDTRIKVTKADIEAAFRKKNGGRRGRQRIFSRSQVDKIRAEFVREEHTTLETLASEYGVSEITMRNVLCGRGSYADTFNY